MPHLIIEVAWDAATQEQLPRLVDAVHQTALACGMFEPSHVKTRAVTVSCYRTGTDDYPFIHAQLRIKPGRSSAQKQALSEAVLTALRQQEHDAGIVTVEVVEMDTGSYARYED